MTQIVSRKPMAQALAAFKRQFTKVMTAAAQQVAGAVVAAGGDDDLISPREQERLMQQVTQIIRRVFVDGEGRAMLPDGTPTSPYSRLLLAACVYVTDAQALRQEQWMRANIPEDIQRFMTTNPRPVKESRVARVRTGAMLTFEGGRPAVSEAAKKKSLPYLFRRNPLREYDPAHTWVDPRGYTLSERIWRTDSETRSKLNAMLRDQIANGNSATNIAKKAEQFLIPGRAAIRTKKPYGRDASYDAMRLARTEIASANNRAAWASAAMNPYIAGMDVLRSGSGDPDCPVCPQYATHDMSGARIRAPYSIDTAITPPFHPHCMCFYVSTVIDDEDTVTANIRAAMVRGVEPASNPLMGQAFSRELMGDGLSSLFPQLADLLGLPSLR